MNARLARYLISILAIATASACAPATPAGHRTGANAQTTGLDRPGGDPDASGHTVTIPAGSPQLRQLRVEVVQTALVNEDEVVAPGRLAIDTHRVSHVAIPFAGRVARVLVRLGDRVSAGQALLTIDSPEGGATLTTWLQARALLASAQSAATKAEADAARARDLHDHQAIALKDRQVAEHALVEARAGQQLADASERQARRSVELLGLSLDSDDPRVTIRAPMAGKVLELSVSAGEYRTDTTAPVMTIADLSHVWVSSDVPEATIRLVEIGERLVVELVAYPGETFEARVTRISDTVDAATRTVQVQAEIANPHGRLRPDMYGRIRHSHPPRPMPVVPAQAIIQNGDGPVVYRETAPGTFTETPVTTGRTDENRLVVLTGLKAGDRVVVDGAILLKAGGHLR